MLPHPDGERFHQLSPRAAHSRSWPSAASFSASVSPRDHGLQDFRVPTAADGSHYPDGTHARHQNLRDCAIAYLTQYESVIDVRARLMASGL
jgi:hypothetical protein